MVTAKCQCATCDRDAVIHGYCGAHWLRVYTTGSAREDVPIRPRRRGRQPVRCTVKGCGRRVVAKGWCAAHLYRAHRFGDPLGHIAIGDPAVRRLERTDVDIPGLE